MQRLVLTGIKFDMSSASKSNKKLAYKRQDGRCAECHRALDKGFFRSGYLMCEYSGTACCTSCHTGDVRIIPARCACLPLFPRLCSGCLCTYAFPLRRAAWFWDLEPAPVCKRVANLLDLHAHEPIVCLSTINPSLFDTVRHVGMTLPCSP